MPGRRRRGRPETPPADFGPEVRLRNRTAILGYRSDPERPSAPAIRAARSFVRYEHMGLDKPSFLAAERIAQSAELCTGAKDRAGASVRSGAFWLRGGPTIEAMEAARYLRQLTEVLGRDKAYAVLVVVVNGDGRYERDARDGLRIMAEWWAL